MHSKLSFASLAITLSLFASNATAHGPFPRPWQIAPLATMTECQAGTETDLIAPYCKALLERFAQELESCTTAMAQSTTDAALTSDAQCRGRAAATAAAQVTY